MICGLSSGEEVAQKIIVAVCGCQSMRIEMTDKAASLMDIGTVRRMS